MMKKFILIASALLLSGSAFAQENKASVELHGFVRSYYTLDSRECVSGTEDFFMYMPRDVKEVGGEDLYAQPTSTFGAITSRLWVEAKGFTYEDWNFSGRIEADYYLGLSSTVENAGAGHTVSGAASMRLRQAFVTMKKGDNSFKIGQAWHPIAADMPDIFSLNVGAPFGPFSRTPMVNWETKLTDHLSLSSSAIYQMQYTSNGPLNSSAIYQTYALRPEIFEMLSYSNGPWVARAGAGSLLLRPRVNDGSKKVSDKISTSYFMLYGQYKKDMLAIKAKSTFAEAGEHIGLNGGYGISNILEDGSYEYTPTQSLSNWVSVAYGKKLQAVFFAGYMQAFGTKAALVEEVKEGLGTGKAMGYYYNKNGFDNINSMWRVAPQIIYNMGKLQLGAEYELTCVQYGDKAQGINLQNGLYEQGIHDVMNHRLQMICKFTF